MVLHTESYAADEPEDSAQRGNAYISKRDFKALAIVLIIIAIIFTPVYQHLRREGERAACSNNMRSLAQAVLLYAEANDGGLPIAYYPDETGFPVLLDGLPITWAALIQEGMNPRASFRCPSSELSEVTRVTPFQGTQPIELTYGMFGSASGRTTRQFDQPNNTVLLAETSNFGSRNTYNPFPFKNNSGEVLKNDGFLVGFDTTNQQGIALKDELDSARADAQREAGDPEKQGLALPTWATRLAFPDSAEAKFRDNGVSRHDRGIHVIYLDGRLGVLRPPGARIIFDSGSPSRHRWAVP